MLKAAGAVKIIENLKFYYSFTMWELIKHLFAMNKICDNFLARKLSITEFGRMVKAKICRRLFGQFWYKTQIAKNRADNMMCESLGCNR